MYSKCILSVLCSCTLYITNSVLREELARELEAMLKRITEFEMLAGVVIIVTTCYVYMCSLQGEGIP